ncbi:MAG: hypothetical protein ACRESZ_19635 [Methylococcales bacterium]
MKPRKPSLAQVEVDWFRPSDRLITRITQDDPNIPPELRRAVENHPEFRMYIEELHETEAEDAECPADRTPPEYFLELADRRHAAQQCSPTSGKPMPIAWKRGRQPRKSHRSSVHRSISEPVFLGTDF